MNELGIISDHSQWGTQLVHFLCLYLTENDFTENGVVNREMKKALN